MIRKKLCLLGTSAVGKTSLARRFVRGIFSDEYLTTLGVKIDKKAVLLGEVRVELLVWDLNGEDSFQKLQMSYLRGSAGYLLVADGTRPTTLDYALDLHERAQRVTGAVPYLMLLNKADLVTEWSLDDARMASLEAAGHEVRRTSAKSAEGVEAAFHDLAARMLG
ncbi:MAG: Rab family GTPase [Bacteroidota bacterium]